MEKNVILSDERLKNHINLIKSELANVADGLPLVEFVYRNDDTHRKVYGVIAQDVVKKDLNDLVHTNEDGMLAVDYTSFFILKLKALSDRIEAIENKLK